MPITETVCEECGKKPGRHKTKYCPDCGTEEPWKEQNAYEFDEDDLPIVFSYEVYDDNHELWREFCSYYFDAHDLKGSDIANLPEDFPPLKYCCPMLWFVITEDLDRKGPFLSEEAAREEVQDSE